MEVEEAFWRRVVSHYTYYLFQAQVPGFISYPLPKKPGQRLVKTEPSHNALREQHLWPPATLGKPFKKRTAFQGQCPH